MAEKYAVAITFDDNAKTFQAFSELQNAGGVGITAAAIVDRAEDGRYSIPEQTDSKWGAGLASGSIIGMLVGVLGGPLGMLLGWSVGATTGALVDASRLDKGDDAIAAFSELIKPGHNAILAETEEATTEPLDSFVAQAGGTLIRQPLDEVIDELEAQQAAAEAAAKAAREELRAKKKAERKEERDARLDKLKEKLHL